MVMPGTDDLTTEFLLIWNVNKVVVEQDPIREGALCESHLRVPGILVRE
jgi:hypothetical protein